MHIFQPGNLKNLLKGNYQRFTQWCKFQAVLYSVIYNNKKEKKRKLPDCSTIQNCCNKWSFMYMSTVKSFYISIIFHEMKKYSWYIGKWKSYITEKYNIYIIKNNFFKQFLFVCTENSLETYRIASSYFWAVGLWIVYFICTLLFSYRLSQKIVTSVIREKVSCRSFPALNWNFSLSFF